LLETMQVEIKFTISLIWLLGFLIEGWRRADWRGGGGLIGCNYDYHRNLPYFPYHFTIQLAGGAKGGATGSDVTGSHVTGSGPDRKWRPEMTSESDRVCMRNRFPRFFLEIIFC
jgi:hypothetical protein